MSSLNVIINCTPHHVLLVDAQRQLLHRFSPHAPVRLTRPEPSYQGNLHGQFGPVPVWHHPWYTAPTKLPVDRRVPILVDPELGRMFAYGCLQWEAPVYGFQMLDLVEVGVDANDVFVFADRLFLYSSVDTKPACTTVPPETHWDLHTFDGASAS